MYQPFLKEVRVRLVCDSGPVHTYIRIFLNPLFFLCGFEFRPHVSGESGIRIRNFFNPLSRMEFLNTLWIRYRVDAKSELYREYCIQDGYLDACSVSNIPSGVLGNRNNPDMCRIRVDRQIRFDWDTCGKTKGMKKWEIQLGSELALFLSFLVLKGHLHDSVILEGIVFLCKLGLLLFKPHLGYQI